MYSKKVGTGTLLALFSYPKPTKGTVPIGGFADFFNLKKCCILAAFNHILPPIGTVPFGGHIGNRKNIHAYGR